MSLPSLRRIAAASSCLIAGVMLAGVCATAEARPIYKCALADGKTVFSDTPCKETASQQEMQMRGGAAVATSAATPEAHPEKPVLEPGMCAWSPPDGEVVVEQPSKIDPALLPHDAAGNPIQIFVGKRGPMTVAGTCSAMVSACSQKSDEPALAMDGCFKSAPRCATDEPWNEETACCPQTCWQKYSDLRRHCVDPSSASYKAMFEAHCVPGTDKAQAAPKR